MLRCLSSVEKVKIGKNIWDKHKEKKKLNFHWSKPTSKQMYIGNFVYQLVTFHTFQNQAFFSVRTEKRAEKWIGLQKC